MAKSKLSPNPGVTLVLNSENAKLGKHVSATYVSQASCPKTCPFIDDGCYANYGNTGIHTRRLNKSTITDAATLAQTEADLITAASWGKGNPGKLASVNQALRLHVVGDSVTVKGTKALSDATKHWLDLIGQVWTYTHAWRKVARRHWQGISVLASCERATDAILAMQRGYAAALVVAQHPTDGRAFKVHDLTIIPCPNQTRNVTCRECKLCWKDQWLLATRSVIAFAAHGVKRNTVKAKLTELIQINGTGQ